MGETYPFLYIDIEQQSPLQNSAMSYIGYVVGGFAGYKIPLYLIQKNRAS